MHLAPVRIWIILFSLLTTLPLAVTAEANTHFPLYDIISPNVEFWTKVYTEYTTSQAIVHDSKDLSIIYAIIDLKPIEDSSARKINRRRMKRANEKYEKILRRLAADPSTRDAECRRVAALFGDQSTSRTFRAACTRVRSQVGQSDRFKAGLVRSGAYIDMIRSIFKSYDLPEELAYLPHVESSFNTKAYSKFGAAGIWQFTRSTGQRFMKVGYVLDERRDPFLATHAAASLLKNNFHKLGSWPLAITAYNHGATGMERAKTSYGDYPAIFESYRSRTFKFASRNFYSEFLAAYRVASNYQIYFGDLQLDRPAQFQAVPLDGYAGFEQLCNHFNVPAETARSLNPALRPPVFEGQKLVPKGYPFRLPTDLALASVPSDLFRKSQKPSHFYTVQKGDTAGKIARINGVKLTDLILANNLDRRANIYPKQTLRIPLPGAAVPATQPRSPTEPLEPVILAKNETEPLEPVILAKNEPEPLEPVILAQNEAEPLEPESSAENEASNPVTTESAPADETYPQPVLASIFPTTVTGILLLDDAAMDRKDEQRPSVEVVSADVRFEKIISHGQRSVGILQVEVEETLGHYAEWADVRTQQIRQLNRMPFGQTLHLHQKIKIPLTRTTAREFEENRYEFHKRLQEDFFAVYRVSDIQPYRVKRGDNLWTLCLEKFDIPMWLLKNCNPEVDFADLHLHQKLMVPAIEKNAADDPDLPVEPELETDDTKISLGTAKRTSL
jgi:membrane-bound lytic murein transglycosylase D